MDLQFDLAAVLFLLQELGATYEFWHWKYLKNPLMGLAGSPWVVVAEDSAPVALCGLMRVSVWFDGREIDGQWTQDVVVRPDRRGRGLAHQIYERVERMPVLSMGLGTAPQVFRLKLKRRWASGDQVRAFEFVRCGVTGAAVVKRVVQRWRTLGVSAPRLPAGWTIRRREAFEAQEVDALWRRLRGEYRRMVVRDGRYLEWKYVRHPAGSYRFLHVRDGEGRLQALAVYRDGPAKACLVDFLGPAHANDLKREILREVARACPTALRLACTTSCPDWQHALALEGFGSYHEPERFTVFAREPVAGSAASDWFVMGGDSDGDAIEAEVAFSAGRQAGLAPVARLTG